MLLSKQVAITLLGCASLIACSQSEAPQPIQAEPVFNKFGTASCRPSDVNEVSSAYPVDLLPCAPEPDGCVDLVDANGNVIPCDPDDCVEDTATSSLECPPPGGSRDPDRDPNPGGRDPGRTPTPGTPGTPGRT